ncbi:MAG: ABC transporter permease [Anaerolineae bacterium]|nr:ABC transporter permease [Anaerolineae bacterium]
MRKVWLVAKHEYLKQVRKRSFLVAVLGFPLLMVAVGGISALVVLSGGDSRPVGYVDLAGVLDPVVRAALEAESRFQHPFQGFPDEGAARAALEAGSIQAYYVVPQDYLSAKELRLVHGESEPGERVSSSFEDFLHASLVERQPPEVRARLSRGFDLAVRSGDGRRELSEDNVFSFLLPFIVAFFMFFAVSSAGGYLLEAVTEEKENRTMEILATSLSPTRLMAGKAVGLMSVSLTQILVWVATLVAGALVAGRYLEPLRTLRVPWDLLIVLVLYFLPTFTLIAGIMTSIGAAVTERQQGQQISGILNMLFILPIFFVTLILVNANSPFLVVLTLFPTTSFLTILLRWGMATVPLWQMVASWVLLMGAALGSLWVAGKVLRMGMLRYGQRLRFRSILKGLRGQAPTLEKEPTSHA